MKNLKLQFQEQKEYNPFVLDVETQYLSSEIEGGWNSIDKFKVSVAVSWDKDNDIRIWHEEDASKLIVEASKFFPIVSYNGEGFDFTVLSAYGDVKDLYRGSKDLCSIVKLAAGHRVHLDQIAKATLGSAKTADGIQAVEWWRSGDPELRQKVIDYCTEDVKITRDLYFFAKENGYLLFTNKYGKNRRVNISVC